MKKSKRENKRRGASMGAGARESRKNRKLGKKWLSIPKGMQLWKEEPGLYKVDILPYEVKNPKLHMEGEYITEGIWYRMPYKLHRNVGPNKVDLVCPTTIGKPCPLCQKRQEIFDDPDLDNKLAGAYRASERSLFALKMLSGNKELKGKIVLWDISDFLFFEQLCVELENGEEEWENFPLLEGGYSLKIRLLEEVFDKTKFSKCDRIDFIEREDYDESILEEVPCLDDVVLPNIKSFKEIQAILEGMDEDDADDDSEEDNDEEENPRKTKKGARKAGKAGKSKPTKGKKRSEPEQEEDDDDDDGDDASPDYDDEAPVTPESWDDLESMDEDELVALAESLDFEIDEDEIDSEDTLREALAEELGIDKPKKGKKKETKKPAKTGKKKPDPEEEEDEEEDEEEEEEEDDAPPPKSKKQTKPDKNTDKKADKKAKKGASGKCPHGHVFGEEFGDHDECDEDSCKKHDACFDEYDSMQDE